MPSNQWTDDPKDLQYNLGKVLNVLTPLIALVLAMADDKTEVETVLSDVKRVGDDMHWLNDKMEVLLATKTGPDGKPGIPGKPGERGLPGVIDASPLWKEQEEKIKDLQDKLDELTEAVEELER